MIHALKFVLGHLNFSRNALFTHRLLLEHHNWLGKVFLTQVHLHRVGEERLHRHLRLRTTASFLTSVTWHLAIIWPSWHSGLGHPRIGFFGLINHFLADSPARFRRLLTKCWEFLRV